MSELQHYGIQGMKWGVRRFQNEDGTLTALGKAIKKSGQSAGKTFKNTVAQQSSQAVVNKVYKQQNQKKIEAKSIVKAAAIAATTTALASLMSSAGDAVVKAGADFAKTHAKELIAELTDPANNIVRDSVDMWLAKRYGVY